MLIGNKYLNNKNYLREFKNKVDWKIIFQFRELSEDFIREIHRKVDWKSISQYHTLSEDFLREFKKKVN